MNVLTQAQFTTRIIAIIQDCGFDKAITVVNNRLFLNRGINGTVTLSLGTTGWLADVSGNAPSEVSLAIYDALYNF